MSNQNFPRPPLSNNPAGVYFNSGGSISAYTNIFAQPGTYTVNLNYTAPLPMQRIQPATASALVRPTMVQTACSPVPPSTQQPSSPNFKNTTEPGNLGRASPPHSGVFVNGRKTGL